MTVTRIPAAPKDVGILSLVLSSAIAATNSTNSKPLNSLKFEKSRGYVVLVIDGLGSHNLEAHLGHAPNIGRFWRSQKNTIRCEFPSTTVVSLAGLTTGLRSSKHGLIGYNVANPERTELHNLLSGWEIDGKDPTAYKTYSTLSESFAISVVSPSIYRNTGFTSLTLPYGNFHSVDDIGDRVKTAAEIAEREGGVVYAYVPELDQVGHREGAGSPQWLSVLEEIDGAVRSLTNLKRTIAVLTADHGMVNVDADGQIYLENLEALNSVDFVAGGDTRSSLIYLRGERGAIEKQVDTLQRNLSNELKGMVWCSTWQELETSGWVGTGLEEAKRPDLVLMASGAVTLYDRRTCKPRSLLMKGHHGSITDAETQVPLIRIS
jgi:predicted AlkP superfamily pyrophosphatase or phosphodiesterase